MPDTGPRVAPGMPLTTEVIRAEGELLRVHMILCMERVRRDIYALIDAIELMKYIDSEGR